MINIMTVEAWDCFAYKHIIFDFKNGIHSIEGVNGSAKTSLFMLLMQGFFNRNAKGTRIDDVNNNITGLPYDIDIHFTKGSTTYSVLNSRKKGTIEIFKNGKPKHVKRIPDNLKIIEDILGCDYAMFRDLIYQSPRSSINLLETDSDNSRKSFLNRILLLDELDASLEKFKLKEKEFSGKNGTIDSLKSQISKIEDSIVEDYQEEQGEIDLTQKEENLKELQEKREDLKVDIASLAPRIKMLETSKKEYEGLRSVHDRVIELTTKISMTELPQRPLDVLTQIKNDLQEGRHEVLQQTKEYEAKQKDTQHNNSIVAEIASLSFLRNDLDMPDLPLEECKLEQEMARQEVTRLGDEIDRTNKELTSLVRSGTMGVCPTCKQGVESGAFDNKITELSSIVERLQTALVSDKERLDTIDSAVVVWEAFNELENKIKLAEASLKECDKTPQEVAESLRFLKVRLQVIEEDLTDVSGQIAVWSEYNSDTLELAKLNATPSANINYEQVVSELVELKTDQKRFEKSLAETEQGISSAESQLKKCREFNAVERTIKAVNEQKKAYNDSAKLRLTALRVELAQVEHQHDLLKIWISVLGPKGFRLHKMQTFLGLLNASMKKYSDMLSDGKISCRFFVSEGEIDFIVTDCNKSISWSCWSEGEKARVKMACLFAVLELLETMGAVSFNVLALDEVFSALDHAGKEGLFRVLNYLKGKGRAIYTIAHTKLALDTEYDSVIRAHKEEDGTTTITM